MVSQEERYRGEDLYEPRKADARADRKVIRAAKRKEKVRGVPGKIKAGLGAGLRAAHEHMKGAAKRKRARGG